MKQLWAPWRLDYILGEKESGCLFCRVRAEGDDRANLVLKRGRGCFCMLNRFPYNNGHLMIVPHSHRSRLADVPDSEMSEMMKMAQEMEALLSGLMSPEGFNMGLNLGRAAGAGIEDHLHLHIVPRWSGDTNFMPVLDDTRVIPQALDDLYERLYEAL